MHKTDSDAVVPMGCKIFDWIGIGESNAENDRSATEGVPGLSATRRRKANTSPAANLLWSCPINRHTIEMHHYPEL